jgi:peptidoglycan-associated lipoprotein
MNVLQRLAGPVTLCVVFAIGAAGCGKKPPPAPPPAPPPTAPAPPPTPPPTTLSEDEIFAKKTIDQLNKEGHLADVYFDLDESTVRDDARPSLQKNAAWLKRWSSVRFTIQGHCDERGSGEYNLALGDRRANAVKAYLISLGVPADRIAIVTRGKESPFCTEQSEGCWQQNRRGHFLITAK